MIAAHQFVHESLQYLHCRYKFTELDCTSWAFYYDMLRDQIQTYVIVLLLFLPFCCISVIFVFLDMSRSNQTLFFVLVLFVVDSFLLRRRVRCFLLTSVFSGGKTTAGAKKHEDNLNKWIKEYDQKKCLWIRVLDILQVFSFFF
jgi:hypothetical protein